LIPTVAALAIGVVGFSAFEAHVINVTAHIENALNVPVKEIEFGTVFPQEQFIETFNVSLSDSFLSAGRVDDVVYKIAQKPKYKGFLHTDILFAFDTTGSMGGAIEDAQDNAIAIMNALKAFNPDAAFGVAHFEDYNFLPYGAATDKPYELTQPITTDTTAVTTAINLLALGSGGDGPQSYTRVMYETYNDALSGIAWRAGAQRILIILGDNVSHDDDLGTDLIYGNAPWFPGDPRLTGVGLTKLDPGRDGIEGPTPADDLDFQTTLKGMADNNVLLYYLSYGTYTDNWQWWAEKTGGSAVDAISAGNIVDAVKGLFLYNDLCSHLSKVKNPDDRSLETDKPSYDTDVTVPHDPGTIANGYLTKAGGDTEDIWDVDLKVPCFQGMCDQTYDPTVYGLPLDPKLEGKDFGCDLWIEVTGISETQTFQCNDKVDNDGDGDIDYPADEGCESPTDNTENSD